MLLTSPPVRDPGRPPWGEGAITTPSLSSLTSTSSSSVTSSKSSSSSSSSENKNNGSYIILFYLCYTNLEFENMWPCVDQQKFKSSEKRILLYKMHFDTGNKCLLWCMKYIWKKNKNDWESSYLDHQMALLRDHLQTWCLRKFHLPLLTTNKYCIISTLLT